MFTLACIQPGDVEVTTATVALPMSMAAQIVAGVLDELGPDGIAVAIEGLPSAAEVLAAIGLARAT